MIFTHAITRRPGPSLISGLSEENLGLPDYRLALKQHADYVAALEEAGLQVEVLDPEDEFPDSTFVEDAAVLFPGCAVLTRPGAASRRGEVNLIKKTLEKYFDRIAQIQPPGTLEGGDILTIGSHVYIGISKRTNRVGAEQLSRILSDQGITSTTIEVAGFLHLKTAITWIGDNSLVAAAPYNLHPALADYHIMTVPADERAAANCLAINQHILISAGCPTVQRSLKNLGRQVVPVDISEFAKLDGGLTCLSLRY